VDLALHIGDLILFQGDSITHAFRQPDEVGTSYQLGAGYAMLIAAQLQAERPDLQLRYENRGACGDRLSEMIARWPQDCLELQPDVISIMIGVVDTLTQVQNGGGAAGDTFEHDYRQLLVRTLEALPAVRLVLVEPFLLSCGAITPDHLANLRPRQHAVRRVAEEFDAVFVPLQDALEEAAEDTGPAYWLFDGIHPNAAAQWLIARQWLRATGLVTEEEFPLDSMLPSSPSRL